MTGMNVIANPRYGCALQGALQTVQAVKGAVPIIHANAGCSVQNYLAGQAGGVAGGDITGFSVPCTNLQERHIVFGGASRLREQIKNTVKVIQGELYVVLGGCASAMIGDDIRAMAKEAADQGNPVIACQIPGFKGNGFAGYEAVVTDILKNQSVITKGKVPKEPALVNIFGIVPGRDICYRGDLEEIRRILNGVGLKVHTFFGQAEGVKEFAEASGASLNLVFSEWGRKPAQFLKETYGIPFLEYSGFPMGIGPVRKLIAEIGEQIVLDEEKTASFLEEEEKRFDFYMKSILEDIYKESVGVRIALAGDAGSVLRMEAFLKEYLNVPPQTMILTDAGEEATEQEKTTAVTCDDDEIKSILQNSGADMVIGSSLEEDTASELGAVSMPVFFPVYDRCILDKTYLGMRGALRFAEDYLTKCKELRRQRESRILEEIRNA